MKKQTVLNKKKKGFTLIELIIVMAIMAILALVALPKFVGFKEIANHKHDVASAKTIANATSTLIADEKVGTDISTAIEINGTGAADTPQKAIEDMLQSIPKGKTKNHTTQYFSVTVTDGIVHVWLGADEVYPNTSSDFK